MKQRWILLALILLVFFTFQRALFADYVLWDDDALVFNNIVSKQPFGAALKTAFTIYYHGDYFPLTLMSYWVDYQLFGYNAQAQHLINLGLHILNVVLLFLFLRRFTKREALVWLPALLFAIHPLQTETAMWISERKSVVSGLFTFLSLFCYIQSEKGRKWYVGALVAFTLACLAKTTSILLPFLFLLLDFYAYGKQWKKLILRFAPMAVVALIMMAMRYSAYAVSVAMVGDTLWSLERLSLVPLMSLNAIGFYIGKFFWPFNFAALYPNFIYNSTVIVSSIAVFVFFIFLSWRLWRTKDQELAFFSLWFVLFLAPVLQLVPRINYVNDRYMYLPIIGWVGILFLLIPSRWLDVMPGRIVGVFSLAMIGFLSMRSFEQSKVWESNRALWENTIAHFPQSAIAHNNVALDYQKYEQYDKAVYHFDLILRQAQDPSNRILAYNNLANLFSNPKFEKYNLEMALKFLTEGLKIVGQARESYELRINLGMTLFKLNRVEEARRVFLELKRSIEVEPDFRFNWMKNLIDDYLRQIK